MDQHELAEKLYEDKRSDYGDGDFTWNVSWDEAGEIIGRENARQDAWEDAWQDDLSAYRADSEITAIRANKPPEVSGVSGVAAIGVALGALGSPAAKVVLGLVLLVGGGVYVLYKRRSNGTSGTSGAPYANERLDKLEETVERMTEQAEKNEAALANFQLPQIDRLITSNNKSSPQRLDEHDGKFGALDKALADYNKLVSTIQADRLISCHCDVPENS